MRLTAEAGTDGAMVALFDPAALPEDFDSRIKEETYEVLSELRQEGRLYFTETGGDGSYILHVYVGKPLPSDLASHVLDPVEIEAFAVPGGSLWFAGAEYIYKKDDSMLSRYPGMGARLEVPRGTYRLRWLPLDIPEEVEEERLRQRMGEKAYDLARSREGRGGICVWMTLLALGAHFLAGPSWWSWLLLILAAGMWIALFVTRRDRSYRAARQELEKLQAEVPDYAAELWPVAPDSAPASSSARRRRPEAAAAKPDD